MRNTPSPARALLLVLLLVFSSLPVVAQELIMTAPPRESVAAGNKLYGPLANYFSRLLGSKVVYKHPGNWLNYQRDMRNGVYDIVFDGPHFASWRMAHLGHTAVVKLPGTLEFYLMRRVEDTEIAGPDQLIGRKICGISPPNLSTLSVLAYFNNPVRQPVILGVKGGMGAVYKKLASSETCDAGVVRNAFYKRKLKDEDRAKVEIIYRSTPLPNQVITVSNRIGESARKKMVQALTVGDGVGASKGIVKRFGGKAKSFIPATQEEYQGHNQLLEGVIFGW